ncbi:MAG: YibE/F family protein [Planctomycetes bacterium]|nr:YibE/F family protein [Planctomycetota bacterium]
MTKLSNARNIIIVVAIWAVVLGARHRMSSWTCPGPQGGVVCRGTVIGAADDSTTVKITRPGRSSDPAGDVVEAEYSAVAGGPKRLSAGRRVFVELRHDGKETQAAVMGLIRDEAMLYLAGIFLSFFVLVGGRQAAGSTMGLIVAFVATVFVLVPIIMAGVAPQVAVVGVAAALAGVVSLLISGIHRRTIAIVAGAAAGLLATCAMSAPATSLLRMTGVYSPLTQDLWFDPAGRSLDFIGLLSAGITLGALGVVIDLATGVASSVFEVADVNASLSRRELAASGLRVGRDVMGTELNTLVFAYAGARVGLLLLPYFGPAGYRLPMIQVLSLQEFAAEAAHIAIGTAGLILTIPLTALAAGLMAPGGRPWKNHAPAPELSRRANRALLPAAMICWTCIAVIGTWLYGQSYHTYPATASGKTVARLVRAEALDAHLEGREKGEKKQTVVARLLSGPDAATETTIHNSISGFPGSDKFARRGDRFLVKTITGKNGSVAMIIDYDRGRALIMMLWCVGLLTIIVGGRSGLRAMVALALCAPVLGLALYLVAAHKLPALPTLAAAALVMCVAVFAVLAGFTRKAACAAGGAFGGIAAGGICAAVAASLMGFSGLQSNSLYAISVFGGGGGIDYRGLLAAGMLLGIVGVAMDVAIAVASAADEIAGAGGTGRIELRRRGMNVGRKIMCTMILALLFAYLGANIPLLILPRVVHDLPTMLALNNDRFASEGLRILAGAIGVVAAIPVTAFLSSILIRRTAPKPEG